MSRGDPAELVPASQLARELHVPQLWLEDEAEAGRLPYLHVQLSYGDPQYLFNRGVVLRLLAKRAAGTEKSS